MSALRQRFPKKPYDVSDDIESFVHVIIFCALRYFTLEQVNDLDLADIYWRLFDVCHECADGVLTGCPGKWDLMMGGPFPFSVKGEDNLQQVILNLVRLCQSHYSSLNLEDFEQYKPSNITEDPEVETDSTDDLVADDVAYANDVAYVEKLAYKGPRGSETIDSKPPGKPLLDTHDALIVTLFHAIPKRGWPARRDMTVDNLDRDIRVCLIYGQSSCDIASM